MLERVDFNAEKLSKENYKEQYKALVEKLVVLQQQAKSANLGMVVLFEGWDGAGKGSRISDLVYNLDARATSVHVTNDFSEKESKAFFKKRSGVTGYYPLMQEFWQALGSKGDITFYDRGWYTTASEYLLYASAQKKKNKTSDKAIPTLSARDLARSVESFERQLVNDGYIVIKIFMHISKNAQEKRLKKLSEDPATSWRVSEEKLLRAKQYDAMYPLFDELVEKSNFEFCPWNIINGEDMRRANSTVAQIMVDAFEQNLDNKKALSAKEAREKNDPLKAPQQSTFDIVEGFPRIETIDTTLVLSREEYKRELKEEQERLNKLQQELYQKRIPLMIMYEGWDAAGKGGNIKRIAQALDARAYTIFPSAAPTPPELLHPHLWRYWTRLPKAGHVGIYDRSWYGRVLVERVEGLTPEATWQRAYDEINEFERDLKTWGAILVKFWVNVSPEEQLVRFHEREKNPDKQWKITEEDWRNREKHPQYKEAADDMFRLTSTPYAPWIILESDDKMYARTKALKVINTTIADRLGMIG